MPTFPRSRTLRNLVLALLSAGVVLGLAGLHVTMELITLHEDQHRQVEQVGRNAADHLQHIIGARLHLATGLAAYAATNRNLTAEEFSRFAENLNRDASGIRSLQLAPGGVVRYVYPLEGNEAAVGHDLMADPRRVNEVTEAIERRRLVLAGPVNLRQGGSGLIGRLPIFLSDSESTDALPPFWGLAIVLLDVDALYAGAGLTTIESEMSVAIRGRHGQGAQGETFYGPADLFEQDSVRVNVRLPTGSWQMALRPRDGWSWFGYQSVLTLVVGLVLALALGFLVFELARRPMLLEATVQATSRQLELTESRYRQLYEGAPDGILIVDADSGRCVGANANACRMLGRDVKALEDRPLKDVLDFSPDAGRPGAEALWPGHLLTEPRVVMGTLRSRDGVTMQTEVVSAAVRAGGQHLVQITLRDITERLAAQAELRKLSTVVERMPNAVVITDPEGIIEYVNPAFAHITGYSQDEVKGQTPNLLKSGRQSPEFYSELWERIRNGETWQGHFINRHRSGALFEEDATIMPVRDDEGRIHNFIAIKTDVTDRLRLEKQLRQAQKMEAIGTLAGGIAHEFNNILTPVMGYAELLTARFDPESKESRYVSVIRNASLRAKSLVSQILQFSRLREGERSAIDLRPVVKEAMRLLEVALPANIEIVLDVASTPMVAVANSTEIHTVLMNLCVNARDAMPEGGTLAVRMHRVWLDEQPTVSTLGPLTGEFIRLEVSDTGIGIPDWALDKIFDPFFSTKGVGKGTGLGLATAYGIVTAHEGAMQVHSQPGKGTQFEVFVPATEMSGKLTAEPPRQPDRGSGTVLLVDDDPLVLEFMQEALQSFGYAVEARQDGRAALELLLQDAKRFKAIVTDLAMPEMGGDALMAAMKRHGIELPVVLTTGNENIANEQPSVPGMPYFLLPKPFTVFHVVDAVQRAVATYHQPRRPLGADVS